MIRFFPHAVFVAGLAVLCWIGAGYLGTHTLALAFTLLIAAFYVYGAVELVRYRRNTAALDLALAGLDQTPAQLDDLLQRLPEPLRQSVRQRVEGDRVPLPGPALTPYLASLLVLLGMLGTFLGMVVTLNGTGAALSSATDLDTLRASLTTPVRGLGLAFGTSIAGIAASAALGLLSAMCRRERLASAQVLDGHIATTLRPYSLAQHRSSSLQLLQQQAELLPQLVGQIQGLMGTLAQQQQALSEQLIAGQARFHAQAEAAYTGLAASVDQTLKQSLADSARLAGAAIQPAVQATLEGLSRTASTLHENVATTAQRQIETLTTRFDATTRQVADTWQAALAEQRATGQAMAAELRAALDGYTTSFERQAGTLVNGLAGRLDATAGQVAGTFEQHAASLLATVQQAHHTLQEQVAARDEARLVGWTGSLQTLATTLRDEWQAATAQADQRQQLAVETLARHADTAARANHDAQAALARTAERFEQHAAALQAGVQEAHATLQAQLAARDAERLGHWTQALETMASHLRDDWQQAGASSARVQQEICDTLARTASEMTAQTEAHARNTIAEIARLVQAASEAPRAAADVVAELRQKLSDSMVRDNAMLEERARLLDTLGTLLDTVNHASTEQRAAIDAMVRASSELMERAGTRFAEQAEAQVGKLTDAAAHVLSGSAEVASLGESFGAAVQLFSDANDKLTTRLERLEDTLGQSIARSDDQLAYYVAQAREVIDLSLSAQKQIVDDLQHLAERRAVAASEA